MNVNNNQVSLAELAAKVGVTEEALLSRSHNQDEVDARSMVVAMLMSRPMRQQDVAPILGITQVAVSKLLARHRRMMQFHPPYRRRWNEINDAETIASERQHFNNTTLSSAQCGDRKEYTI